MIIASIGIAPPHDQPGCLVIRRHNIRHPAGHLVRWGSTWRSSVGLSFETPTIIHQFLYQLNRLYRDAFSYWI
jgi:hypothetical protein